MIHILKKYRLILVGISIAVLVILLIVGLFSIDNSTNEMIVGYLNSNQITVDTKPIRISHITIPSEFDKIYESYNQILLNSGFDLSLYKGKSVIKYTYRVTSSDPQFENAYANVFLHGNTIIAADISRLGTDAFIKAIQSPQTV